MSESSQPFSAETFLLVLGHHQILENERSPLVAVHVGRHGWILIEAGSSFVRVKNAFVFCVIELKEIRHC